MEISSDLLAKIHPSIRDSFVPLPSDPSIPLTPEQLQAVFPHPEAWRDMIALVMKQQVASTVHTSE